MKRIVKTYLPFYEDSMRTSPVVAAIPLNRIWFPEEVLISPFTKAVRDMEKGARDKLFSSQLSTFPDTISFHKILPLDIYVPLLTKTQGVILNMILAERYESDKYLKVLKVKDTNIDGSVTVFDYYSIADEINILDAEEGGLEAMYLSTQGLMREKIESANLINLTISGEVLENVTPRIAVESSENMNPEEVEVGGALEDKVDLGCFDPLIYRDEVFEAYNIENAAEAIKGFKTENYDPEKTDLERIVTSLMVGDQSKRKSVPCLVGLSGVAKSAIIKKIARNLGYRMVDFRAAFLDRLDMEGMFYLVDKNDEALNYDDSSTADKFTKQAFLGDFVKVSDQYIDYAQKMADRLKAIKDPKNKETEPDREALEESGMLESPPASKENPEPPSGLDKLISKFEDEARPAVLFFDEIIRAKPKILNLFTILLDTKTFGELTFFKSKIAAAANTPHGLDDMENGEELFVGQELEGDPAVFNRLSVIAVTPQDQYPGWIKYITDSKWDKLIIEFVTQSPNYAYDLDYLNSDKDIEAKRQATYPTFRGWELVNRLMVRYRKDGFLMPQAITGILGDVGAGGTPVSHRFIEFLQSNQVVFSLQTPSGLVIADDHMMALAETNFEAGVPTGLFGPSGLGKTSRIKNIASAKGYEVEVIQLSQKSPSDIMGAPSTVDTSVFMLGDIYEEVDVKEDPLVASLSLEVSKEVPGLPPKVTIRAPQKNLRDKVDIVRAQRAAGMKDAKLILFFDEVNRIAEGSESVQSAVFEAISDNRFAGVDLHPDEVSVAIAANVDYEELIESTPEVKAVETRIETIYGEKPNYGATKPLDSAFKLRISSFDKKSIDMGDVDNLRLYVADPTNGFNPVVTKFFEEQKDEAILLFMKSAEYKSIYNNVPAVRNFSSLSAFMDDNPGMWGGSWFFPSTNMVDSYRLKISETPDLSETIDYMLRFINKKSVMSNWVALTFPEELPIGIPNAKTPQDVLEAVQAVLEFVGKKKPKSVITFVPLLMGAIMEMEDVIRSFNRKAVAVYLGDEDGRLGVTTEFLNLNNELSSGIGTIDYPGIVDRETARMWVESQLIDELEVDVLVDDRFNKAIQYMAALNKLDEIAYVVIEALEMMESTVAQVFIKAIISENIVFEKNDKFFSKYNGEIVRAVTKGASRNLGPSYDTAVKALKIK